MEPVRLDPAVLRELDDLGPASGRSGLLESMVAGFLGDECPRGFVAMRDGLEGGDLDRVAKAAHAVRGSSAALGAMRLASWLAEIEQRARAGSSDSLSDLLARAERELSAVEVALAAHVSSGGTSETGA